MGLGVDEMTARMSTAVIAGVALLLAAGCNVTRQDEGAEQPSMEAPTPIVVAPNPSPVSDGGGTIAESVVATPSPMPATVLTRETHRLRRTDEDSPAPTGRDDGAEGTAADGPDTPVAASVVTKLTTNPSVDPRAVRDVSGIYLFSGRSSGGVTYSADSTGEPTLEEILEAGLRLAGASPVHIAFRGTASASTVRCDWRGIARTPTQRERAIRFWLGLEPGAAVPDATYVETLFTVTLATLNPRFRETSKSNFLAIARGGLSAEYLFLACYVDYAISEHLLGSGASTLTVAYDRMGDAHSYELYLREHSDGSYGDEPLIPRGVYESSLLEMVIEAERSLSERIGGYESVVFLAPMGAHHAIAVEAWQAVAQWDLQMGEDGTLNAVRYGTPEYDPEYSQTLASLSSRITTATTATSTATSTTATLPERIPDTGGLEQYYRDIGAYDDITPGDGSAATFTPAQPPGMPSCAGTPAASGAGAGLGLTRDCTALLESMAALAGTASLDWNASTTISSWEGITLNASSTRVTGLDIDDEDLNGTIPAALGDLSALETLDLSDNDLSGAIPIELGRLWNLRELRLSGNSLTGCIPLELRSVPVNDLASLSLPYCEPPAPENLTADTPTAGTIGLSWDTVPGAARYRVEHHSASSTEWTVHDETIAGTSHTVDGLACGIGYRLRVRSYGDGVSYEAVWSLPSAVVSETTGKCVPAVFDPSSYSFSVAEDAATSTLVGTVRAIAPGDVVTYVITLGNDDDVFAMGSSSGEITVAGALDHESVPSYSLTVEASTERSGTTTAMVEIMVTDVLDEAPPAPSGLSASLADGTFTIGWVAVAGAAHYEAQHQVAGSGASWAVVGTTTATLLTYSPQEALVCGTTYEFRVRAYGDGTAYVSDWGEPSVPEPLVYDSTYAACTRPPRFDEPVYSFEVPEDAPTGHEVGAVSATDLDEDDAVTYEITAGNEGGAFVMGESSGAITVAGALDYETTPSYSLTVAAGDGRGGTATTTVSISVTNVIELPGAPRNLRATMEGPWVRLDWDAPSDPTVTGYQVLRRRPQEGEQSLLVHEEDTGSTDTFYIDMRVAPETMYAYRVKAINADGVGPRSNFANITTGALSAPPAPSGLAASASEEVFAVTWDALGGAALYEVEHRTAGGGQSYATTTPDTMLTISPEGGPACGTTYEFKVRAYGDGTLLAAEWGEYSEPATLMTAPCNRAPEFGGPYSFTIPENAATSTPVVTVLATDRDQGDTVTYTITLGNEAGRFAIGESSGEITVAGALDHETEPSYMLTVEASDGRGGRDTTTVEVIVTDVAEELPPSPQRPGVTLTDDTFGITWGAVEGAADYEVQQRVSGSGDNWAPVATTTGLSATYSPSGGVECGTTYEFRVLAYGDGTTYVAGWGEPSEPGQYMTDACNRAPGFATSTYSFTVAEDATTTDPVGTVLATDRDDDPVSYAITGGNAAGKFDVSTSTGAITVAGELDHETVPSYTLTVEASDGRGGTDTTTVAITVTDVAEDPPPAPQGLVVTLADDTFGITWSAVEGAAVYEVQQRVSGSDDDWALVATTRSLSATYSPSGGAECGTTYEFRVLAYGDGTTYVSDVGTPSEPEQYTTEACNRPPQFRSSSYTLTISENAATSTPVGTISATDPDGDTVSYSITAGNEAGKFAIATSTGAITLTGSVDPDVVAFYALRVEAGDGVAGASSAAVGVALLLDECSNGTVVPRPRNNPELVRDCSMLLSARDTLAGEASLDWSAETRIHDWEGVTVEPRPFSYVRVLLLTEAGLTGRIPPALGGVADLRRIDLDYNMLTGEIPRELGSLSDMVLMYLHTNRLTGSIPPELGALSNLQSLFLSDNMLTGVIPAELGKLRSLRELTIENNSLTGSIPSVLGGLTRLQALYLSENTLTGVIPAELGKLRNLRYLVLERNSLGGEIPSELGDLTRLVAVYLRNNGLTGSIPAGWGDLSNLAHLYLSSGNDLTGCIPSGLRDVADNDLAGLGLDYCS